jgi:hypothetical protein
MWLSSGEWVELKFIQNLCLGAITDVVLKEDYSIRIKHVQVRQIIVFSLAHVAR